MVVHRSAVKADQRIGSNRVQDFFGIFVASVGFFFRVGCACAGTRPARLLERRYSGTAFCRDFATVCALRGPFLVVLRDPSVRVETTLAHQH